MSDEEDIAGWIDLDEAEVTSNVHQHMLETDGYQAGLRAKYEVYHHYFAPPNNDQWPEDGAARPGKIHMTVNIVQAAVNVGARLQAILPRLSLYPNGIDEESRKKAETAEKILQRFLDFSDWEVWLADLCTPKGIYGKGVLKPFWNNDSKSPDVVVLENPGNLRLGYGSNDFTVLDWAIYEYSISPIEAMRRFPRIEVTPTRGKAPLLVTSTPDHADPIGNVPLDAQARMVTLARPSLRFPSEYEDKQVGVWDYWYRDKNSLVHNAIFINGVLAQEIKTHPELIDIPYIVIENDHEPGSPEGVSDVEKLMDIQYELNRLISHWSQLVKDEIDPAFQLNGENSDGVPAGLVPKSGEIVAPGSGNTINPISKGINQYPLQGLIDEYWKEFHRISGLSEILFGQNPAAQTTGRALAVQVEAAVNRLDFKRRRLYRGIKQLLIFWTYMLEKQNPKIKLPQVQVDANGQRQETLVSVGLGDLVSGFRRWKIVPPELTPKDSLDNTNNEINKVSAKLSSLKTSMDQLGIDNPEDELALIAEERSNAKLFPGEVQAYVAVQAALLQLQQQMQAMQQAQDQLQAQSAAGAQPPPNGQGQMQQQAFEAQPRLGQDQNEAGAQPITQAGGSSPAGGTPPGGTSTTLVRSVPTTGQAQTLNQIAFKGP